MKPCQYSDVLHDRLRARVVRAETSSARQLIPGFLTENVAARIVRHIVYAVAPLAALGTVG